MRKLFKRARAGARIIRAPNLRLTPKRIFKVPPKTFAKIGLVAALATFAPKKARAAGGVEPPPNPAKWATTLDAGFTYMHIRKLSPRNVPTAEHARINYNLFETPRGPVAIFEQLFPHNQEANGVRVGLAQEVSLPGEVVAKLGVLGPETGKNPLLTGTDFGLILTQEGNPFSFEGHFREGGKKSRASVSYDLGKHNLPNPEISFGTEGYFGPSKSVRVGLDKVERLLNGAGVNLGKVTTGLGFNIPLEKGERPLLDVYAIKPISTRANLGMGFGFGKETTFKGFLAIDLGRKRPKERRPRNSLPKFNYNQARRSQRKY